MLNPLRTISCLIEQVHKFYDLSEAVEGVIKEQFADSDRQQQNLEVCKKATDCIGNVLDETQQALDDLAGIRGLAERTYSSNANTTS